MNLEPSEGAITPVPWEGVAVLARHWSGSGSLFDLSAASRILVDRDWSPAKEQARLAYALLLYFERSVFSLLPQFSSDWVDLLEQEIHRRNQLTDHPTAHTDWSATLSQFGRFPSTAYVERLPRGTFDTPLTRTLKWFCRRTLQAVALVERVLGQHPLPKDTRAWLVATIDLPEVQGAADAVELDEFDLAVCAAAGGAWTLIGDGTRKLATIWQGGPQRQLFELMPILPPDDPTLFELGVLGTVLGAVNEVTSALAWTSRTPLAAASGGKPCLSTRIGTGTCDLYYQSVPSMIFRRDGPYRTLTKALTSEAGVLRPDIWLITDALAQPAELLLECKYSSSASIIAEGVLQVLAYWAEYPPRNGAQRLHMVVGPETVVHKPRMWASRMAIGAPSHLRSLVIAFLRGGLSRLTADWA